jgi:small-conductance mechanosensitive channel
VDYRRSIFDMLLSELLEWEYSIINQQYQYTYDSNKMQKNLTAYKLWFTARLEHFSFDKHLLHRLKSEGISDSIGTQTFHK